MLAAHDFISCKKEDEVKPKPKTKAKLLTAKSWRISGASFSDSQGSQEVFSLFDACSKDDILRFSADKTVVFDEGPARCDPSAPQTTKGAWDLTSNESKLIVQETANSSQGSLYDVTELTENKLSLRQSDVDQSTNTTYTITLTYSAF
ncbi:lipocalin family protein [Hymenobacter elongatus]|uniref:Lipocalin-like domain-containing protein n=1 Tax=Hymenobacter elongatus TaxID=877208 RepID=A0A4Z0PRN1_9BACT|nr:lipocalin family protein [Hymenobacter elongatus]TGE19681.1 hypothetical protein E5J99_02670 [Hymenobacter elongatus]